MIRKLLVCISLFLIGCSDEKCIERDKFVEIYANILAISANRSISDIQRKAKIDSLLNKNGLIEEQFKCAEKKYSKDPLEWKDIYKEILDSLEVKKHKYK